MDGLLRPEPVTVRVHAIQDEVLPANPGVEHLRHVCPHILEARLLRRRQGLLRALVVTAVRASAPSEDRLRKALSTKPMGQP